MSDAPALLLSIPTPVPEVIQDPVPVPLVTKKRKCVDGDDLVVAQDASDGKVVTTTVTTTTSTAAAVDTRKMTPQQRWREKHREQYNAYQSSYAWQRRQEKKLEAAEKLVAANNKKWKPANVPKLSVVETKSTTTDDDTDCDTNVSTPIATIPSAVIMSKRVLSSLRAVPASTPAVADPLVVTYDDVTGLLPEETEKEIEEHNEINSYVKACSGSNELKRYNKHRTAYKTLKRKYVTEKLLADFINRGLLLPTVRFPSSIFDGKDFGPRFVPVAMNK